ncbi:hypothetical protein BCR43DRAFT_486488 [Syncephalastrum racemosum]|uniref:Mannose-P-dolichol utilization defect 1 protein homolog n=1 Tax=Syncephalastrum racemosum TaxID=13706 RepID=A0A1X2HP68_SYNRA|nr:hypothetical protein BCR43DRAFT_486488 [Syncephalastrum racemosum]
MLRGLLLLVVIFCNLASCCLSLPIPAPDHFGNHRMILPPLLKEPLVALVGQKCYTSLVEDLNVTDVPCLKYSLSKGLGFGIVLGGSIVKIPQIITILTHHSAQGLSLASNVLETLSCIITTAYNLRQGNPFSTWGETCFLTIQNTIITLMILFYARQYNKTLGALAGFLVALYALTTGELTPSWAMSGLYAATIPLSLASKVPQIYTNFSNGSTGQLSVFAVLNYFLGTTARVFTTMTELDDPLMLTGVVLASLLNAVLVIQVFLYWGKKVDDNKPAKHD